MQIAVQKRVQLKVMFCCLVELRYTHHYRLPVFELYADSS